jgi:hypothetical protein
MYKLFLDKLFQKLEKNFCRMEFHKIDPWSRFYETIWAETNGKSLLIWFVIATLYGFKIK